MSATLQGACYYLRLGGPEKHLLGAMADHANDDGLGVWPGNELLAQKTSRSVRTVQRLLKLLEAADLIARVAHPAGGRGHSVEWALNAPAIYEAAREEGWTQRSKRSLEHSPFPARLPEPHPVKGDTDVIVSGPERVTSAALKGDIHDVKGDSGVTPTIRTTIEPSVEPSFALKRASRDPVSSPTSAPTRPRDPLWDTLVDILGAPSPAKTSLWGDRVKWIRAQPDGTPDKIRHVASRIVTEWGTRALTVNAVVDHWSRFDAEVGQVAPGDVTRAQADARHARIRAALNQPGGGHP